MSLKRSTAKWGNYEVTELACTFTVTRKDEKTSATGSFSGKGRVKRTVGRRTVWSPRRSFKGSLDGIDVNKLTGGLQGLAKAVAGRVRAKLSAGQWKWA